METNHFAQFSAQGRHIEESVAQRIENEISGIRNSEQSTNERQVAEFNRIVGEISKSQGINLSTSSPSSAKILPSRPAAPAKISFPFEDQTPVKKAAPSFSFGSDKSSESEESGSESASGSDDDEEDDDDDEDESDEDDRRGYRKLHKHKISSKTVGDTIRELNSAPVRSDYIPRERLSMERMISEIDIYRTLLRDTGHTGDIPDINERMDYFEVSRTHNLLKNMADQRHYSTLFEDLSYSIASGIETIFDGSIKVFGRYGINYRGLASTVSMRLRHNKSAVASAVSSVAEQYGVSPSTLILLQIMTPLITIPVKNIKEDTALNLNNPKTINNLANYDSR